MAFDDKTRSRLSKFVGDVRKLLSDEFKYQLRNVYGLDPDTGDVTDVDSLPTLSDNDRQTAEILRELFEHYLANAPNRTATTDSEILDRIVREQAFTVLNRLCAVRMAEARELVIESIAKGQQSKGFQLYSHLAGHALGETGEAYMSYVFSVLDEFALDLPVLFDRFNEHGRLFPREAIFAKILDEINHHELEHLWAEDETIGWIYQYFNSKEERKAMRDASQAPRNSRELAVRNQFFTPRYVVEFLTDNTLGRIWYEMRKGETRLKDECHYLVRRPNEIFLADVKSEPTALAAGDQPENETNPPDTDLTQEELLNQPVRIPHRPLKDPREIRMLDPACGSMHFGLYAFDLYLKIYEEYWDLVASDPSVAVEPTDLPPLAEGYESRDAFIRDVPRLIIEHNIHGIDIDPRAVQIAGLSLWLRAQRAWHSQGLASGDRPQVTRSNVVCAEPMPGDQQQLEAFCKQLHPAIAQMVTAIFEEMKLAGEAGSLLKIEQEISSLVAAAKKQFQDNPPDKKTQMQLFGGASVVKQQQLEFDLSGITDELFFEKAEEEIYSALRKYASESSEGGFRRKLFAGDAEKGFALIELVQRSFDAVLANPPFGDASTPSLKLLDELLGASGRDIGAAFVCRWAKKLTSEGMVGFVLPTSPWFKPAFESWRESFFFGDSASLFAAVHLGGQVLDNATVAASATVLTRRGSDASFVIRAVTASDDDANRELILNGVSSFALQTLVPGQTFLVDTKLACSLLGSPFAYWVSAPLLKKISKLPQLEGTAAIVKQGTATANEPRFSRAWWEVPRESTEWMPYTKSSEYSPLWDEILWVGRFGHGMDQLKATGKARVQGVDYFGKPGVTFPSKSVLGFNPRLQPEGCSFGHSGSVAFPISLTPYTLLAVLFSRPMEYLLSLALGGLQGEPGVHPNHYEVGTIQRLPWPLLDEEQAKRLNELGQTIVGVRQKMFFENETSRSFCRLEESPTTSLGAFADRIAVRVREAIHAIEQIRSEVDKVVLAAFGFSQTDVDEMDEEFGRRFPPAKGEWRILFGAEYTDNFEAIAAKRILSFAAGRAFGHWQFDSRDNLSQPSMVAAPMTVSPLSMSKGEKPSSVLPHDELLQRIRDCIGQVLKHDFESELVAQLGYGQMHDYFSRPTGFFQDHLSAYSQYSNGRRSAPIYWPISTESGSYTLWFYYHRLTDQTLYKAVNDFVDPKLRDEIRPGLKDLRAIKDRTSAQEKELAQLTELESELEQFKVDLLEIAVFWKPNLNDGVQITAAPLHKFFRLKKWRDKLAKTWKELQDGKYDWAHLALSIWPDRVVRKKCTTDRSIAIAHDLEEQLWHEVEVRKTSKTGRETTKMEWQPKELTDAELDAIVEEVKAR